MNIKRYLRGPLFWISLAILLVIIGSQVISSASAAKKAAEKLAEPATNNSVVAAAAPNWTILRCWNGWAAFWRGCTTWGPLRLLLGGLRWTWPPSGPNPWPGCWGMT